MSTEFFVNFISFDKEKSTRFPGILSKLGQQLSQYIDIQQQSIIDDLNQNQSKSQLESTEKYNMWTFIWQPKIQKLSDFIAQNGYIGTKVLRVFLCQNDYTDQDLDYEALQKLPIYNIQRLNNPNVSNNQKDWKTQKSEYQKNNFQRGQHHHHHHHKSEQQQNNQSQRQEREPETFEEYSAKIIELQEKLKEMKGLNKELKDTNYILADAIENQNSIVNTQEQQLNQIQQMLQNPLKLLFPEQDIQDQKQNNNENQQEEEQQQQTEDNKEIKEQQIQEQ